MKSARDFGAVGDGKAKDTAAIQHAIDTLASSGGGVLTFTPGVYLTGTVYLRDNITLDLQTGATILGSPDMRDYNADDFCPQNRVFAEERVSGAHLIVALEVHNIGIRGGGRIDGNRKAFYNAVNPDAPHVFLLNDWRPGQMIFLCECHNVTLDTVEFYNAPYWTCFLHGCQDVTVNGLRIWNDQRTSCGDGLDIDCCRRVTVANCNIESGDDCITLRGCLTPLKNQGMACEQITITNCILRTRCNAIRIGVGNGLIRNCTISNIVFWGTRTAVCIVSRYSRKSPGVTIENVQFENLRMDVERPVLIASNAHGVQDEESKLIRNISFRHLTGRACMSSLILGNSDRKVKNISIQDVDFDYYGGKGNPPNDEHHQYSEWGGEYASAPNAFYAENVDGITFRDIHINIDGTDGPWLSAAKVVNCKAGRAASLTQELQVEDNCAEAEQICPRSR